MFSVKLIYYIVTQLSQSQKTYAYIEVSI